MPLYKTHLHLWIVSILHLWVQKQFDVHVQTHIIIPRIYKLLQKGNLLSTKHQLSFFHIYIPTF